MPRALEAVHVGLRKAVDEVVEVAVAEDRILGAPEQQRRDLELRYLCGDPLQFGEALVSGVDRDVGDEGADAATPCRRAVRRAVSVLHGRIEGRGGEPQRRFEEGAGVNGGCRQQAARAGNPQRGRNGHPGGLVNGGVEQHHTRDGGRMVDGPAERYDAAPVVTERYDGAIEIEGVGERSEVGDSLGQRTRHPGAFRVPHLELVHRDDTPGCAIRLGGTHRLREQAAPEIGPRGVAVHSQNRSRDRNAQSRERRAVVEKVPLAGAAFVHAATQH